MTVKERMAVKVLWLANWTADEIARFEGLSEKEVEELIKVFKGGKRMSCIATPSQKRKELCFLPLKKASASKCKGCKFWKGGKKG